MSSRTIGTFEAKAQLSHLLDRVAQGETITITRHGTPIAKLVPFNGFDRKAARQGIEEWMKLRTGNRLGKGISLKALREEGRR